MKHILKENDKNIMYHCTGKTRFTGCQCFKDCTCNEDFISTRYEFFLVKRKKIKTTTHRTIEEANQRWEFINNLPTKPRGE